MAIAARPIRPRIANPPTPRQMTLAGAGDRGQARAAAPSPGGSVARKPRKTRPCAAKAWHADQINVNAPPASLTWLYLAFVSPGLVTRRHGLLPGRAHRGETLGPTAAPTERAEAPTLTAMMGTP